MNRWEKLINTLKKIEFKDVSGNLHFHDAETWQTFKKQFNPQVKIPDYLLNRSERYETGEMKLLGIQLEIYGPSSPNPNWTPPRKDEIMRNEAFDYLIRNTDIVKLLWEAIAKDLLTFDSNKIQAFFHAHGLDWQYLYGTALTIFSNVKPSP